MQLGPVTIQPWQLSALALAVSALAPVAAQNAGQALSPRAAACIANALSDGQPFPLDMRGDALNLSRARMLLAQNGDITFTYRTANYDVTGTMGWKGDEFIFGYDATPVRHPQAVVRFASHMFADGSTLSVAGPLDDSAAAACRAMPRDERPVFCTETPPIVTPASPAQLHRAQRTQQCGL